MSIFAVSRYEPSPPGESDEGSKDFRLMRLVRAGETDAFVELVERHQRLVVGTVARMLGNNSDVEDIAQQVFVRIWKNARCYVPQAKFTTWLLKITRNLVFNELRRRSRHAHLPLRFESEDEDRPIRDERATAPDTALLERELQYMIETAIAQLPETQRMALALRRSDELSYEEIAEVLDQSVPAVKSLLFRARTELRGHLSRYLTNKALIANKEGGPLARIRPLSTPHSLVA